MVHGYTDAVERSNTKNTLAVLMRTLTVLFIALGVLANLEPFYVAV